MLARVSARELIEMQACFLISPWGEKRDNMHAGIMATTLASIYTPKDKKPPELDDFMLAFEVEAREKTSIKKNYESIEAMRQFMLAHGRRVG